MKRASDFDTPNSAPPYFRRRQSNHNPKMRTDRRARSPKLALTRERRLLFARAYVASQSGVEAAKEAGYIGSRARLANCAASLLRDPFVCEEIDRLTNSLKDRLDVKAEDVARYWYDLATADARELSPVKRSCCRFCWGIDHQYQFTLNEMRSAKQEHHKAQLRIKDQRNRVVFDELGGDGYDHTRNPNPECPECRGHGIVSVIPIDLNSLSRQAVLLYDGVKVLRDGTVEVKLRDRSRAMENFQQIIGLLAPKEKEKLRELDPSALTDDELERGIQDARRRLALPDLTEKMGGDSVEIEGEAEEVTEE